MNIYNSEAYAREVAEKHGIVVTSSMTHVEIIDLIEEWEEEFC